jgi:hypothetical protein
MLMVRNLCRLALLFSVQDHKQSLCHFIFYLLINHLAKKTGSWRGKAASAFRLCGRRAANLRGLLPPTAAIEAAKPTAHHSPTLAIGQGTTHSFDKHSH